MLYVFHGTDLESSRKKALTLVNSLRAKRPDAAYDELNSDNWNSSILESHLGGQGLFSSKYIVFLNRITDHAEGESLLDFVPVLKESQNIFIVLEGKLTADFKKAFTKSAEKLVESEQVERGFKKPEFNIFSLGEALGSRDPIKSWVIYRQAIDKGMEPEAILGTLFWQVKSILLVSGTKTASDAGLNPFVYSKSKRFESNFSKRELNKLAEDIITIYHDGHRGLIDIELSVEKLLLNLKK